MEITTMATKAERLEAAYGILSDWASNAHIRTLAEVDNVNNQSVLGGPNNSWANIVVSGKTAIVTKDRDGEHGSRLDRLVAFKRVASAKTADAQRDELMLWCAAYAELIPESKNKRARAAAAVLMAPGNTVRAIVNAIDRAYAAANCAASGIVNRLATHDAGKRKSSTSSPASGDDLPAF